MSHELDTSACTGLGKGVYLSVSTLAEALPFDSSFHLGRKRGVREHAARLDSLLLLMRRHGIERAQHFRFLRRSTFERMGTNQRSSHLLRFGEAWCFRGGEGGSCIPLCVLFLMFKSTVRRENGRKSHYFLMTPLTMLSVSQNQPSGRAFFRRES